ncbi:MAG: PQQ-binding-like beta-propeller repeat protein [Candidatus Alcyoniella australis]|nr:PQQ-binding-like beta-propeller repeat protein [Candidatus Alcyoniella australis]
MRQLNLHKAIVVLAMLCLFGALFIGCEAEDGDQGDEDEAPRVYRDSPWPMFRNNHLNNGRSFVAPLATQLEPWTFDTAKGMFHAPVIDGYGTIYIGSADTNFYAINPDGSERWRVETDELIDSTAVVGPDGTIYVPCGDGYLRALDQQGNELWRLAPIGDDGFLTWWEGHLTMRQDGTLFAGNDDRRLYAISTEGEVLWTFPTGDQIWSLPAFHYDGTIFFGSNDLLMRSLDFNGAKRWNAFTLGPVSSSPAIFDDGTTVVVGSFDGHLHAFTTDRGYLLWSFPTRDHIYSSPAIAADGTIYVGSTDGTLYAINPDGTQRWAFDTLDPIRSSPAIDAEGNVYFGCGDGRIYSLDAQGDRRWSFDTSISDRNDLNGSPALSYEGAVIGGESGQINFVPYDYCQREDDPRCSLQPEEDIAPEGAMLYHFTSGGSSTQQVQGEPIPTEVLTFRLVVRRNGDTVRARIDSETLQVTAEPDFRRRVEVSADGNFVSIIPEQDLGMSTAYTVGLGGDYITGGLRIGNKWIGGKRSGSFAGGFDFTTAAPTGGELPLSIDEQQVDVLLLRRLAVPQPPMMTTFNQIGFDSYNFLLAPVFIDEQNRRMVLLAVEGTPGLEPTILFNTRTVFALNVEYVDSYFSAISEGFAVDVNDVSISLDQFRLSGRIEPDRTAQSLNAYAEVRCSNIEFFGRSLDMLGLCHPRSGKMILNGTAMFAPRGELGKRPTGLELLGLEYVADGGWYNGGYIEADFAAPGFDATQHLPVIVVLDSADNSVLDQSYGLSLERMVNESGELSGVRLHVQPEFNPSGKTYIVVDNLFPLAAVQL